MCAVSDSTRICSAIAVSIIIDQAVLFSLLQQLNSYSLHLHIVNYVQVLKLSLSRYLPVEVLKQAENKS